MSRDAAPLGAVPAQHARREQRACVGLGRPATAMR